MILCVVMSTWPQSPPFPQKLATALKNKICISKSTKFRLEKGLIFWVTLSMMNFQSLRKILVKLVFCVRVIMSWTQKIIIFFHLVYECRYYSPLVDFFITSMRCIEENFCTSNILFFSTHEIPWLENNLMVRWETNLLRFWFSTNK